MPTPRRVSSWWTGWRLCGILLFFGVLTLLIMTACRSVIRTRDVEWILEIHTNVIGPR